MPKTKNEKNEAKKQRNALRNQLKDVLRKFVEETTDLNSEIKDAILFFAGKKSRSGGTRTPGYMIVIEKIKEATKVSEDDIWNEFKMGRTEMRNAIRKYIKGSEPGSEIHWISLNEDGDYEVMEISSEVPEGWDGPLPSLIQQVELESEESLLNDEDSIDL